DIADTYAQNAATALLNFDQLHAADLFSKAFDAVKDWDKSKALDFKISQGDALTDRGSYTIDNDALNFAIATYNDALALAPRESDPANWAKIQDRIGQTQGTLGSRSTDPAMLQTAATSMQAALAVESKDTAADRWAATQNNLGNVLRNIGARQSD